MLRVYDVRNYDYEFVSLLVNSINEIQIENIHIVLLGNDETKLRNCRKFDEIISNFQTNNIASNDVGF